MGCRSSKEKLNKEGEKRKMCKIGLSLGRNKLSLEGNLQVGYHSKTDRKYSSVDGIIESGNGNYELTLAVIHEEEEEKN